MADDKRGAHLCDGRPQRIGLSATVKPVEEIAQFLGPRTHIVDVGHRRAMDIAVEIPRDELGPVASNEMWGEINDRITQLILTHRTTLVFVNARRWGRGGLRRAAACGWTRWWRCGMSERHPNGALRTAAIYIDWRFDKC